MSPHHVGTRMDRGTALLYDYVSGKHELTVGALYAQTLTFTVAAVFLWSQHLFYVPF